MRRRGTGSTSIGGGGGGGAGGEADYPNYLPVFRETTEPQYDLESPLSSSPGQHHRRASSFHSFLTEKSLQSPIKEGDEEDVEDVKADVLYPRYKASKDDHVDIAAFNRMVQDRTRKMSTGTLQLSKTLSRQNQLYGSSKNFDAHQSAPSGIRFKIYSSQRNSNISTSLVELLTEQGQKALESVVESRGWWVDVLCPSVEEMRVLSKVRQTLNCSTVYLFIFRLFIYILLQQKTFKPRNLVKRLNCSQIIHLFALEHLTLIQFLI